MEALVNQEELDAVFGVRDGTLPGEKVVGLFGQTLRKAGGGKENNSHPDEGAQRPGLRDVIHPLFKHKPLNGQSNI